VKRGFKYLFLFVTAIVIVFSVSNCRTISYGIRQGVGQVKVLTNAESITKFLNDSTYPDSLKAKIRLIQEIKQFTVDSLGLEPSGSYKKMYDQKGEPLIWMMLASKPYELKPYEWKFPIVGTFTYKGHFKKEIAIKELQKLKDDGYDVRLGKVAAWSTLGYLNDPILSEMLNRDVGQLSALIIHELTHGTLYIKNNVAFNENLADFVGDYGAIRFLTTKYGSESAELKSYFSELKYNESYTKHMLRGSEKLQELYADDHFRQQNVSVKDSLKNSLILDIMLSSDTLSIGTAHDENYWRSRLPNNAYFVAFINYQSKQNEFKKEFEENFGSNFNAYLAYLKKRYAKSGLLF
jgi:predicted aminopeptidase